jgi:hypothetical protein
MHEPSGVSLMKLHAAGDGKRWAGHDYTMMMTVPLSKRAGPKSELN